MIPIDKELIPTHNIQRVAGKQFLAVDMEEKVGDPISQEEFSRCKVGSVEEIVYEIKVEEPVQSIYTYRSSVNTGGEYPAQSNRNTMQVASPPP